MADLTALEQQIMKDYGQYIAVPIAPARTLPTKLSSVLGSNYATQQAAQRTANLNTLSSMLPSGVTVADNQLQITPGSDLYQKYATQLTDTSKPWGSGMAAAKLRADLMAAIIKQNMGMFPPKVLNFNDRRKQMQQRAGALSLLGLTGRNTSGTGAMYGNRGNISGFQAGTQLPQYTGMMDYNILPQYANTGAMYGNRANQFNPAPVLKTNTLEQAMQAYAAKNNMSLDKLIEQINATKAAQQAQVQNTPQSIEDVNRMLYTPSAAAPAQENLAGLEAKYAQGGRVRTHYAEGDLVETAPDYTNVPTEQTEPSGGGYVAPQMLSANPELNALLQSYNTGADYSKQLEQARQQRAASEADFNKSMENLVSSSDAGPSKAELYWKLAAAFGTPAGKTGQFGENLASAAGTMADYGKEQRAAETAKRKLSTEIGLKKQEMALESAKDTEKTLLGLQSEANKDRREMIKASVKEYIDSGKPQSEAGRIAKDKGLTVGSPEYQAEVDKQANLLIEKQLGAIKAQMLSSQATIAGLGVQQAKEAREAVKLEPDERKAIRDDEDAIHAAKSTMTNIDEAIGMVDKAFSNTIPDKALYRKLKQTNPQDPRVIATEQLENLLGTNVLGSLKATFGGNPTEGERAALRDLQGLSGATPESRKKMLERAKKALAEGAEHRSMRINKIETGGYRKKTTE